MATEIHPECRLGERRPAQTFKALTAAEERIFEKASVGARADCSELDEKGNDPRHADDWTDARKIRAEMIAWLCMDPDARRQVHSHGIWVVGVDVIGELDLSMLSLPFQLVFEHCRFTSFISLQGSELPNLELRDCVMGLVKADGLIAKLCVILRNSLVENSEVRLTGAQIGLDLDCSGATFNGKPKEGSSSGSSPRDPSESEPGMAICAQGIKVKGRVHLSRDFSAKGQLDFLGAQIEGVLDCQGGHFEEAQLRLTDSSVSEIYYNNATKWPTQGNLNLDGFSYKRIVSDATYEVGKMLDWLALQPGVQLSRRAHVHAAAKLRGPRGDSGSIRERTEHSSPGDAASFPPFPLRSYVQMATVLRESGDDLGNKCVLEQMELLRRADRARRGHFLLKWPRYLWSWLLRWTICYGLHPLWAIAWLLLIILVGWATYDHSYSDRMIAPTDNVAYQSWVNKESEFPPPNYPRFSPFVFSIENSLPLVKFGQIDKWQPDPSALVLIVVQRIQLVLGWLLSGFFLAGLSGIVRKE